MAIFRCLTAYRKENKNWKLCQSPSRWMAPFLRLTVYNCCSPQSYSQKYSWVYPILEIIYFVPHLLFLLTEVIIYIQMSPTKRDYKMTEIIPFTLHGKNATKRKSQAKLMQKAYGLVHGGDRATSMPHLYSLISLLWADSLPAQERECEVHSMVYPCGTSMWPQRGHKSMRWKGYFNPSCTSTWAARENNHKRGFIQEEHCFTSH